MIEIKQAWVKKRWGETVAGDVYRPGPDCDGTLIEAVLYGKERVCRDPDCAPHIVDLPLHYTVEVLVETKEVRLGELCRRDEARAALSEALVKLAVDGEEPDRLGDEERANGRLTTALADNAWLTVERDEARALVAELLHHFRHLDQARAPIAKAKAAQARWEPDGAGNTDG